MKGRQGEVTMLSSEVNAAVGHDQVHKERLLLPSHDDERLSFVSLFAGATATPRNR